MIKLKNVDKKLATLFTNNILTYRIEGSLLHLVLSYNLLIYLLLNSINVERNLIFKIGLESYVCKFGNKSIKNNSIFVTFNIMERE